MKGRKWLMLVVTLALLGVTAGFLSRAKSIQRLGRPGVKVVAEPVYDPAGQQVATQSVYLPPQVLDYASDKVPIDRVVLEWLPKDTTYGQRLYRAPDGWEVLLNVVLMGTDRTSIHKPEYCLDGMGWKRDRQELDFVTVQEPHAYQLPLMRFTAVRESHAADGSKVQRHGLYVFWFVADGELTALHEERMWWMARDLITSGVLQRWAYIACFSVCQPGQEEAVYGRMKQFIAAAAPKFQITAGPALAAAHHR